MLLELTGSILINSPCHLKYTPAAESHISLQWSIFCICVHDNAGQYETQLSLLLMVLWYTTKVLSSMYIKEAFIINSYCSCFFFMTSFRSNDFRFRSNLSCSFKGCRSALFPTIKLRKLFLNLSNFICINEMCRSSFPMGMICNLKQRQQPFLIIFNLDPKTTVVNVQCSFCSM